MYKFQNSKKALYLQLYEQIKEEIITNKLKANAKLPSIRTVASDYKISKNTVQTAYTQLLAEGYIHSCEKKGFFVSEDLYKEEENSFKSPLKEIIKENISYKYDFFPANLNSEDFPKKLWLKIYNKVLKQNIDFGVYQDMQGLKSLRFELKNYLQSSRGVVCSSDQIVLCSGFSDAMFIVSTLLKNYTKTIAIEENPYRVAQKVFMQNGFDMDYIPVTKQGIDLESLKDTKAKLLYITPAHQYFNGHSTPISNRNKLIKWAKDTSSYIIEDDYDSELSYKNKPIPSLQGINNNDRVIFFGTLSKSFSPALRVAYMILPTTLLETYKENFDYHFSNISLDTQKTLEVFIKEGYFISHIRKIRTINRKKHNLMKKYLQKYLKDEMIIIKEGCGLHITIKPTSRINLKQLEEKCKQKGLKIYIRFGKYLSMGFGQLKENEIQNAIEEFSNIWKMV